MNLVLISHPQNFEFPDSWSQLSQTYIEFSTKDYEEKWGSKNPNVYTPSTNLNEEINIVLEKNYKSTDNSNPFRVIQYNYTTEEPVLEEDVLLYSESFKDVANLTNYKDNYYNKWIDELHKPKGILKVVQGTADIFQPYTRGTVKGIFTRLNNKNGDSWFITPQIDLKNETNPILFFRLGFGFYKGFENFELVISTDFDGNPNNILNATWKDLTNDLKIKTGGTYGDVKTEASWVTESSMNSLQLELSEYTQFGKVYIGFRDHPGLNPSSALPFTVIDQIKIEGIKIIGVSKDSIEPKMALYKNLNGKWEKQTEKYYILTKTDYNNINLSFLSETQAKEKLPTILATKVANAKEKEIYSVIYKTSETKVVGDVYRFTNGKWEISNDPKLEKRNLSFKNTEMSW